MQIAEEQQKHKSQVITVATGWTVLGYCHKPQINQVSGEEYQHLLLAEVKAVVKVWENSSIGPTESMA